MTKTEIEEKIKNGESVWAVEDGKIFKFKKNKKLLVNNNSKSQWGINYKYRITNNSVCTCDDEGYFDKYCFNFDELYKTKAEAEHYLNHANVTRTETLPFLTWEEFKEQKQFTFIGRSSLLYRMRIEQFDDKYLIFLEHYFMESFNVSRVWDLTEANFYKAYDECVRLFKGE